MSERIRQRIEQARARGGAIVPFVVLGDPGLAASDRILRALVDAGADCLEFGLPFSDPPADGPVIQAADVRALQAGVRVDDCFDLLRAHAARSDVPVSLLVYFNLVLQRGVDRFYADCAGAGVDAVLIADLPLEHSAEVVEAARSHGVAPVFLTTPVSDDARIAALAAQAGGYLYVTARVGVTGETADDGSADPALSAEINRLRGLTDLPLLCGFGISGPASVRRVLAAGADGAIVGSAVVRRIAEHVGDAEAAAAAVGDFVRSLVRAARER